MDVYETMRQKGITLPTPPGKGGLYAQCKLAGGMAYVSGCGCSLDGTPIAGKLGAAFGVAEGRVFARNCMLNVLAVLQKYVGDLNRVKSCAKVLAFVASADDFVSQPQVADGATELLKDVFGEEAGLPARSAIGVNVLPGNLPVEIEAIFEIAYDE